MSCFFRHRWRYDLRFHHIYRQCEICALVERHAWNRDSVFTAWEQIRERVYVETAQKQIVRKRSSRLVRLAHSLGLIRTRASDRATSWARST